MIIVGCVLLGILLVVDWHYAGDENAEEILLFARFIVTTIALLCLGCGFVWSLIIGVIWCFVGGVIFRIIGEEREDTAAPRNEPANLDTVTEVQNLKPRNDAEENIGITNKEQEEIRVEKTTMELFDEAVEQTYEDAAIIYAAALLEQGEMNHVMLGFKKLEKKGLARSKELYLSLVCQLSSASRKTTQPIFFKRMTLNEIEYALGIIKSTDGDNIKQYTTALRTEQLHWEKITD